MTSDAAAGYVLGLSHLALAGRVGRVVVIAVYMDESGTHDGSPALNVAAYAGRPETWAAWTAEWTAALSPIKVYHAVDAQNCAGEFSGWTAKQVAELAERLLPITARHNLAPVSVGLDMRVYDEAMAKRPDLREIFGTPYTACFQWAAQILINAAYQFGNSEPIAFIHEANDYHQEAMAAFAWMKDNKSRGANPLSLTFGGKKDYVPLQAADILAYETNKRIRNPAAPERRSWQAIKRDSLVVTYGDNNITHLIESLDRIKNGKHPELVEQWGWNRSWGE